MSRQDKIVARGAKGAQDARIQYGALCWRRNGAAVEVLLITSRETGRWVIPKGWPMTGRAPEAAAAQEAWEEAGVRGQVNPVCLGRFGYMKCLTPEAVVPCAVAVYGVKVDSLADKFPEAKVRTRRWFEPAEAAASVDEPELARLIAGFTPAPEGRAAPIGPDGGH
ncbi:NUDIX hydrolase [Tabrizicola sp. BL-A-41-H6]|uniref:NUDIX hydrolase n=1 Tax=Tabrizicola sp. BL-A-41-H6 TaxID=3421107 RepID=UPI003D675450